MECTRHTVLFRKYQCAPENPSFYALTSLFPSSLDTQGATILVPSSLVTLMTPRTRALKIQGLFVNLLSFRQIQPFRRLLSISMTLKRSCALSLLLCLFILAHCLDPHHGDNKTDIDQFVLTCIHTVNVRYSSLYSPSQCNTCHQHPRRPCCQQQAQRFTFCARLTIKRTSPSCLILTFGRPSFADHPRAFISSGDYSTALFWTTPTRFDLRETSVTTLHFFFGLFLSRPYSRLQI